MRTYTNGVSGLSVLWGLRASVFPRALVAAIPNAMIAGGFSYFFAPTKEEFKDLNDSALSMMAGFSSVLFFVLYLRSNVAYNRWWEGGTLLQQVRGEWFNAYSSLLAFTSQDPARAAEVEAYQHMLARLMSLLFCSALQQVSPEINRRFEILDCFGFEPSSMDFLAKSTDKVEVILQWVQRSTILNMTTGVLASPPPVMSRAFQEISRGVVNLQNARKIADFPFPFPYAQIAAAMLFIHWAVFPVMASLALTPPIAAVLCFGVVFFLWSVHFTAMGLEHPFGTEDNDLPMEQMQREWNKSLATLLTKKGSSPPRFVFDPTKHRTIELCFSDGIGNKRRRSTITRIFQNMMGSATLCEESEDDEFCDNLVIGKTKTWEEVRNHITADHRDSNRDSSCSKASGNNRARKSVRAKLSLETAATRDRTCETAEVSKDGHASIKSTKSEDTVTSKKPSVRFSELVEAASDSTTLCMDAQANILKERIPLGAHTDDVAIPEVPPEKQVEVNGISASQDLAAILTVPLEGAGKHDSPIVLGARGSGHERAATEAPGDNCIAELEGSPAIESDRAKLNQTPAIFPAGETPSTSSSSAGRVVRSALRDMRSGARGAKQAEPE
mmetsp:Transcript_71141/g.206009  ORF Transcript_71141/g.206009 Transcript_71141/m.206009 type:complete len:613 (-) Transcript_71141:14-1852(-)